VKAKFRVNTIRAYNITYEVEFLSLQTVVSLLQMMGLFRNIFRTKINKCTRLTKGRTRSRSILFFGQN
jgi:hypothetical protein